MKIFSRLLTILAVALAVYACSKDEGAGSVPLRDYAEQYQKDIDTIDWFLDHHYMVVSDDLDVTFQELPNDGSQESIRNQTQYPLQFKTIERHGIEYKLYYISLREGENRRPSWVDSVFVSYKGVRVGLQQFDSATSPVWLKLDEVVRGWSEIVPFFKTGFYDGGSGGPNPVSFTDFGAGVMFIPSGLGYYAQSTIGIPPYSPLIFSFKLYELRYRDHDADGILSKDEVANPGDNPMEYDLDGDGIPNYYDVDDDGDTKLTRLEYDRDPETGEIILTDCDGDGVWDYLDPDNDGDGIPDKDDPYIDCP